MRTLIIIRINISVKYKVIASRVDSQEMEAEKVTNSNKKRKYRKRRNLSANERIERQVTDYMGVCWNKKAQRWLAQIPDGKKIRFLGHFDSDYDAAMRYDEEARKYSKSVNFPYKPEDVAVKKKRNLSADERIERQETEYVGVCWNKKAQRWSSSIRIKGKRSDLGCFDSDYDAAMKYDDAARKHGKPVNFLINPEDIQAEKPKKQRKLTSIERIERQETEYVGVSWSKSAQQWVSQVRVNKKIKRLGYFDSDKGAAMKYDEEARKHGRPVNFPINLEDVQAKKQTRKLSTIWTN